MAGRLSLMMLVGQPDAGLPGHAPIYGNDGERVGWVRTEDFPH